MKGKITTLENIALKFGLTQDVASEVLDELKIEGLIACSGNIIDDNKIFLTDIGMRLVDDLLSEIYSHKQRVKALFYLLSKREQETPILFEDIKTYLGGKIGKKSSKVSNVLNKLKKDSIIKNYSVKQAENNGSKKAIRLTKLGCSLAKRLLYEGLTPNELLLLNAYKEIPSEKRSSFIIEFLAEYDKKLRK